MKNSRFSLGTMPMLGIVAMMVLFGAASLHAQRFQHLYGDSCADFGGAGKVVSTGGYISVGSTSSQFVSTTGQCAGQYDVFVVRTDNKGAVVWERAYDLGGSESGSDVFECANGDFVITGSTNYVKHGCIGTGVNSDAFILRITSTGSVVWARLYGTDSTHDNAWAIIEAGFAQSPSVNVGDLVIAGAQWNIGLLKDDAWLMRVNGSTGAIIWTKTYGGAGFDRFFDLCESKRIGAAGNANRGDIISVGVTTSYSASASNGFIVRVDGATGTFAGGAPRAAAVYGSSTDTVGLYSVAELAIRGTGLQSNIGDIICSGDFKVPGTGLDIYVLKTAPNPCTPILDQRIGDNGASSDEGYCIREVNLPAGSGLNNGDLYVGGMTTGLRSIAWNSDGYIVKVNANTLTPLGNIGVYGSPQMEGLQHIAPVGLVTNSRTAGVVGFGSAHMSPNGLPIPPDQDQMWMLKTNNNLSLNCCDTAIAPVSATLNLPDSCTEVNPRDIGTDCSISVDTTVMTTIDTLCNDSLGKSRVCPQPPFPAPHRGDISGDDGGHATSGVAGMRDAVMKEGIVSSYPNPVKSGSLLSLTYALAKPSTLSVIVSDLSGHVVYRASEKLEAGTNLLPIVTERWSPGTYIIRTEANGRSSSVRVVVSGK